MESNVPGFPLRRGAGAARMAAMPSPLPEGYATCKACRRPVSWGELVRSEREIQPRVFERAYICPHCRAVLEFASWQTGITRKY